MIEDVAGRRHVRFIRTKVGQSHVIHAAAGQEEAALAGEGSGGVAVRGFQPAFDGFLTMGLVLETMADRERRLSALVGELPRYHIVKEKIYCPPSRVQRSSCRSGKKPVSAGRSTPATASGRRTRRAGSRSGPPATEPMIRVIAEDTSKDRARGAGRRNPARGRADGPMKKNATPENQHLRRPGHRRRQPDAPARGVPGPGLRDVRRRRPVLVGRDARASGMMLEEAVIAGLLAVGCRPVDVGICSHPLVPLPDQGAAGGGRDRRDGQPQSQGMERPEIHQPRRALSDSATRPRNTSTSTTRASSISSRPEQVQKRRSSRTPLGAPSRRRLLGLRHRRRSAPETQGGPGLQ